MNRRLEGKVALVTGGSSGIGLATAERFVAEGAFVYITGRRQAHLGSAVKKIGSNVKGVQADVSRPADLDRLYAQVKRKRAASTSSSPTLTAARSCRSRRSPSSSTTKPSTIIKGVILTVQKALPLMPDASCGAGIDGRPGERYPDRPQEEPDGEPDRGSA